MKRHGWIAVIVLFATLEGLCFLVFGIWHWLPLTLLGAFVSLLSYRVSRNPTLVIGFLLLFFGLITGIEGYKLQYPDEFDQAVLFRDFYANVSTEAISIAITVIIIDSLNKWREARQEL